MTTVSSSVMPFKLSALMLCALVILAAPAFSQGNSPLEVVIFFAENYGGPHMDEVADYTTAHFRDNKPKSVWVVDTWKALKKIKYTKLDSEILDSKLKGNKAVVITATRISTVGGDASQKEIFYLVKKGERWLIDELVVTDEEIDVNEIKL